MNSHTMEVRVRWGDVDWAGIVFYPRFYEWFDLACDSLFDALGLPWPTLFPRHGIVGVPIVESGARFASPVRWGDLMRIRATVAWVKDKTFRMEYEISVDGRACASGFEVRAWVKRPSAPGERLEARPIPDEVARLLRGDPA
ncbi:MAG TPA: thioesterase family protein [Candidatus Binatia bacterium]|nr:thioesterase family protein [Candidatus Binatia bacterium]